MSPLYDRRTNADASRARKRHKSSHPIESLVSDVPQQVDLPERLAWRAFFATRFFLQVPNELFSVFALATDLRPARPCEAFVDTLGIQLCGPFDLLAAAAQQTPVAVDKPLYLHGRFFFDPPEVVTVMADCTSHVGRHWGYFRDAPDQVPAHVVCAEDSRVCKFAIVGSRLLDVLQRRVTERRAALGEGQTANLLEKMELCHCSAVARAQGTATESALRAQRAKHSVAASLHQLGIVVPLNAKTRTGYRELPTTGQALADLLQQLPRGRDKTTATSASHHLSELMTRATMASDECDFGTGLLLGLDVFTAGACVEKEALQLLRVAYQLLRRTDFYKVASMQCTHRKAAAPYTAIKSTTTTTSTTTATTAITVTTVTLPASLPPVHKRQSTTR